MTEQENKRVDDILENAELEIVLESFSDPGTSRPSTRLSGFYPEAQDIDRLLVIDKELQTLIPETEWETKSFVWSSVQASGIHTPISSLSSRQSSHRQLMNSKKQFIKSFFFHKKSILIEK
jgi:hypothetical protein